MATPNFASPENASKYYAVLCSYERPVQDEDGNDTEEMETVQPDEWEVEDFILNIKEALTELKKLNVRVDTDYSINEGNRSYPSTALARILDSKTFGDCEFNIAIVPIMTSAYYEGATLDYLIELGDYDYDDVDEFVENYFEWNSDMPKGMQVIQAKNAVRWIEKRLEELKEAVEQVFEQWTQYKLVRTALFSNGEAIYEEESKQANIKAMLHNKGLR